VADRAPIERRAPQLGLAGLVFVLFFTVSGGAYTLETLVVQLGPVAALAALVLIPILWVIPEALIVGELASRLPEEGGYYRWVQHAFGERAAVTNAWCTWCYSLVEMALYPALVLAYLEALTGPLGPVSRMAAIGAVIWIPTLLNLLGAVPVGRVSIVVGSAVLLAFGALAAAAWPRMTHAPWATLGPAPSLDWSTAGAGLGLALWNWIGWDNASTIAGEVRDPGRTYPRALVIAVPLVALGYAVPLLVALSASDWRTWQEAGWPAIARDVGGAWGPALGVAIGALAVCSATAMFNSLLLAYSRIPLVVARDRLLPAWLGVTDGNGTPVRAVLLASTCYTALALLPFAELISADVVLYAIALFLEFAALVQLRRREPDAPAAFRIPLGTRGVTVLACVPAVVLATIIVLDVTRGEYGGRAMLLALAVAAVGPLLHTVLVALRARRGERSEAAERIVSP
jgi:amino acid transporter